ncbi:MAG: hypothetical protein JKX67_04935 [Colwellia sp.]|nr:hypothetical protein [Colwellia sp.]
MGTERVVSYYRASPDGKRILFGGIALLIAWVGKLCKQLLVTVRMMKGNFQIYN